MPIFPDMYNKDNHAQEKYVAVMEEYEKFFKHAETMKHVNMTTTHNIIDTRQRLDQMIRSSNVDIEVIRTKQENLLELIE